MIVVDTSVWVGARRDSGLRQALESLIDADEVALALPVRLELLAGIASKDRRAFLRTFAALPQLVPTDDTWAVLPDWIARASEGGERFALTDLLIGSLASEIGGRVWSLDSDFERMARLQLVSLYG
jgi:predicted nucleic acid-binding protein